MKCAHKNLVRDALLGAVLLVVVGFVSSCSELGGPKKGTCEKADKIRAIVVTGGHGFEHDPFFSMFEGYSDIEYVEAVQEDHSEIFEDIGSWDYDVIVLYNMTQEISPQRRKNFTKLLRRGVGVLALHHSMGSFQQWDEYAKIIGGKYVLPETAKAAGTPSAASSYKHGVDLRVHIEDSEHPITRGMSDFDIHDETYKNCTFEKDNHVLLSVDHPTSDRTIAWARQYGKAPVCFIQLGHDSQAYMNPNYRLLLIQAMKWCAGRLK